MNFKASLWLSNIMASSLLLPFASSRSVSKRSVSSKEYVLPSICEDFQLKSIPTPFL